jgi:hypothetical protein
MVLLTLPYFSIHNALPNIFIASYGIEITCICLLAVELGSTDRGRRNYFKARALLIVIVVILSLMKIFLDLDSLIFNKY